MGEGEQLNAMEKNEFIHKKSSGATKAAVRVL
jgi:hypothetical protein